MPVLVEPNGLKRNTVENAIAYNDPYPLNVCDWRLLRLCELRNVRVASPMCRDLLHKNE